MRARLAKPSDTEAIYRLISHYAEQGLLLPRAEEEIRRNIHHFVVIRQKNILVSCLALENYGGDLAEIRSLAVNPEIQGRGIGKKLVDFALEEARRRGIARVFAVTQAPEFFLRQGFELVRRQSLTEKIDRDCRICPKRRSCKLIAVIATVIPQHNILPVIGDTITSVPAS
jgi:N-acetylglutamate synthase-like GNAT family acetyltransferase